MKFSILGFGALQRLPQEWKTKIDNEVVNSLQGELTTFQTKILNNFDQGLSPKGTPWTPLSQITLSQKLTNRILYETGGLRGSYNFHVEKTKQFSASLIADNFSPVAEFHEYGTRNMPKREILAIEDKNITDIMNGIAKRIASQLESGFNSK